MRKYPFVKQEGNKDCGVSCLSMIIEYYGGKIPIEKLRELTNTKESGVTAYDLIEGIEEIGFHAKGMRGSLSDLENASFPLIAHFAKEGMGHYVVIYEVNKRKKEFLIADPSDSIKKVSYEEFSKTFDGVVILLYPYKKLPIYSSSFSFLSLIFQYAKDYKREFLELFFCSIFITMFSVIQSFFFQFLLDQMEITQRSKIYFFLFYFFVGIVLLKQMMNLCRQKLFIHVDSKIDYFLHYDIFRELIFLPYRFYQSRTTGEITSKMNDLEFMKSFFSEFTLTVMVEGLLSLVCFLFLFQIHRKFALIALFTGILILITYFLTQKSISKRVRKVQGKRASSISHMVESFLGFRSIKGLLQENEVVNRYLSSYYDYVKEREGFSFVTSTEGIMKGFLIDLSMLFFLLVGVLEILEGKMSVGTLVTSQMLFSYFLTPFESSFSLFLHYEEAKHAFYHIKELFYQKESFPAFDCSVHFPLEIKSLTYGFQEDFPVLKNVSLKIESGEHIFVSGNSGSGKSTLMDLLFKYYPVKRTMITFGSIDLNDISEGKIRHFMSYLSQEEVLFTNTLWFNLTLGRRIPEEEVFKVARICEVEEIASQSTLGYFMPLEENGKHLSGGEKERILLARTLLQNRTFLVIDEGMGEMDTAQERRILKRIMREYPDRTLLFISHRMDNMDLFSRLLEFDHGKKKKDVKKNELFGV